MCHIENPSDQRIPSKKAGGVRFYEEENSVKSSKGGHNHVDNGSRPEEEGIAHEQADRVQFR